MSKAYLVLGADGNFVSASTDPEEAAAVAGSAGPFLWAAGDLHAPERAENPPTTAERALQRAQLSPVTFDEVMRLSEREAHARLLPYFQEVVTLSGGRGEKKGLEWGTWSAPGKGILGENTKLHKRDPSKPPAVALGISLLPEASAFRMQSEGGVSFRGLSTMTSAGDALPTADYLPAQPPAWLTRPEQATLCAGASGDCRKYCLVNTGQNRSDYRNNLIKRAKAKALIGDPVAFLRLLLSSLDKYAGVKRGKKFGGPDTARFVRLNVFSDVPWEEMAPWLFAPDGPVSHRLSFYDYTKVAGRPFMPRYDLSFSYSGMNMNLCDRELRAGRRVVMVFVDPVNYRRAGPIAAEMRAVWRKEGRDPKGAEKAEFDEARKLEWLRQVPLPSYVSFPDLLNGARVPVVDGDVSDVRPFDPPGVAIGLRYKPPPKSGGFAGAPQAFVLRGTVGEGPNGPIFSLPETPVERPVLRAARV